MNNQQSLVERLRGVVQKLRRTPMPIADVAPMLTEAADRIEQLEAQLSKPQDELPNIYGETWEQREDRASRPTDAQPADFDTWINNPYTKVLQKSIAEDYVPKHDAQPQTQPAPALTDERIVEIAAKFRIADKEKRSFYGDEYWVPVENKQELIKFARDILQAAQPASKQEPVGTIYSYKDNNGRTAWDFRPLDGAWKLPKNDKVTVYAAPRSSGKDTEDAERYRWLRNKAMGEDQVGTFSPYVVQGQIMRPLHKQYLDAAVDVAMEMQDEEEDCPPRC